MGLYINSATSGLLLGRSLYQASAMQTNIMKRLSSGIKINSASDDAAGLSLSQKLTSVINGNTIAKNNAQTGIAMLNTADGALSVMTNSLERIRNLAVQAANGVYSASERQMLQQEIEQLSSDMRQTRACTTFSDKKVFNMDDSAAIAKGYDQDHIIHSAEEFLDKIYNDDEGDFIITDDLDFSSLGTANDCALYYFGGKLDGNGHTISNINIQTNNDDNTYGMTGLFSYIQNAEIKNLNLQNININSNNVDTTYFNNGLLGGYVENSQITNVNVSGSISGYGESGLLAGEASGSTITNCSSSGTVNNLNYGSGGSGIMSSGGGLIGYLYGSCTLSKCSSSANVTGSSESGGLIGSVDSSTVSESFATGNVSSTLYQIDASNKRSFAGGLIGSIYYGSSVTNSYATGSATADMAAGTGAPNGGYAGGLIGYISNDPNTVTKSYAANGVVSTAQGGSGGFTGRVGAAASVNNTNFYKNNKSVAAGNGPISAVNANVSAQPTGTWDTNVWDLSGALPTLKSAGASKSATTLENSTSIQVGAEASSDSQISFNTAFNFGNMDFDVTNQSSAYDAIKQADQLMTYLNNLRSNVGASINKLSSTITIQDNRINNLSASRSTINDADVASESAAMIKTQIRMQSSTTLLSQVQGLDANLLMKLIG